jgi:hypothetical protein
VLPASCLIKGRVVVMLSSSQGPQLLLRQVCILFGLSSTSCSHQAVQADQ